MNITSFSFFIFIGAAVLLYYVLPKKYRFVAILAANIYFLIQSNSIWMNLVWLLCAVITYGGACLIEKNTEKNPKVSGVLAAICVVTVLLFMIVLKDSNFFVSNGNRLLRLLKLKELTPYQFPSPLGISYYSLVWVGYLLDVYWGTCKAERNPLKFFAFCGYFPTFTSGPIAKFQAVEEQIVRGNAFSYERFCFGLQRILWGLMKKLIISERLAIVVNMVYGNTAMYPGFYVWIAMIFFVFQLYTDFSGCIDIVLGVSELFGVELPENFDFPFLSKSLAEFWRHWHITLGGWLRDYVLYPLLKAGWLQKIGAVSKKKFGKKTGKKIPTWIGLFISWFLIGFWHGGYWNYIIGVGLFFGTVIILSEMLEPVFDRIKKKLQVNTESFSYVLFQRLRTFFIFMVGLSFFRSYEGFGAGLNNWKNALTVFNPWILTDGSLLQLGLTHYDYYILLFFGGLLAVSGLVCAQKKENLRTLVARQGIVFRWIVYLLLVYAIIIYGCYGIEFDSAAFIYQRF